MESEDGPTAVEYAIVLAVIITTCVGSLVFLGDAVSAVFNTISSALTF